MKLTPETFARLGVWASLGLALHAGMVSWARAAETDLVPRWAVVQCVTFPPGVVGMHAEGLAEQLAAAGLLQASPVGFRIVRGRVRTAVDAAARRAHISAVRAAAGRAGAAARWGRRVAAAAQTVARTALDRLWPARQSALPLERPAPVHHHHAVCGRVCLPLELARELGRKLGGADGQARIEALARAHLAALGDAPIAGAANDYVYWRRVAEAEGWLGAVPARRATTATPARPRADLLRAWQTGPAWTCPHQVPCSHKAACAVVHARELRTGVLERRPGHEHDPIPVGLQATVAALRTHVS